MKKVIVLEFHVEQGVDPHQLLTGVALACVDAKVLIPGDVVRNADEGVGYEVQRPTGLARKD